MKISEMRFTKKEIPNLKIGRKVLYRCAPSGWGKDSNKYYKITGSDWHSIGSFYIVPKGKDIGSWSAKQTKDIKKSTHVHLAGVGHSYLTWAEFLKKCVKPELFYPNMKMKGMPFEIAPDKRY